jgi:hypothetical protein
MAKGKIADPQEPEHMIRPLVGAYRGQHIYAGEDYDQAIAEGWAVDAHAPHPEPPGEEIEDLDEKIGLAQAMIEKWTAAGGPGIAPAGPTPKDEAEKAEPKSRGRAKE